MNYIYLDEYKEYPSAKVNTSLLWECDMSRFDYREMRDVVVQRVVERGWPEDWHAILNMYGEDGVIEAIKAASYLNDTDMNFVSQAFQIPLIEMKCYERKQSRQDTEMFE